VLASLQSNKVSGLITKKRFYILLVSRDEDGTLRKVPVPLHYAYLFAAVAVIGLFTVTGLAGSYSRMLIKTARFNQLRHDHQTLQQDYAHLEKQAHEKDIQAASLGSLASEVSALYGFTAGKLTNLHGKRAAAPVAVANAPLKTDAPTGENYYKSLDAFYSLRDSAMDGDATRLLTASSSGVLAGIGRMRNPLLPGHDLLESGDEASTTPTLWPINGPISSSFGEREDPVLGTGEGEFHAGIDISGPLGAPIHATADGVVVSAGLENGYGRMVRIDHGHGLETCYGHMSGFAVTAGQAVSRGDVIGYVGHSGRTTGNHVHYEVRIHNTPVNPHKYLRSTLAELGGSKSPSGF
jgi:murein DD-endopeptidase MepM/ murein hydrolase activator NlpD